MFPTFIDFFNRNRHVRFIIIHAAGIAPEKTTNLFQIDKAISTLGTKNETGTGLGLICSQKQGQSMGRKRKWKRKYVCVYVAIGIILLTSQIAGDSNYRKIFPYKKNGYIYIRN